MHDNSNLETNECFLQNLHSNNNEWNSMIDFVRHYMYSKAERHTLRKKLEKIADQLSFKPKLFFCFWGFFFAACRNSRMQSHWILILCVWNLRQWQFKLCAWYITRNFFSLLIIRFLRYALKGKPWTLFLLSMNWSGWMNFSPAQKSTKKQGRCEAFLWSHLHAIKLLPYWIDRVAMQFI